MRAMVLNHAGVDTPDVRTTSMDTFEKYRHLNSPVLWQRNVTRILPRSAAEELDALNARARRKSDPRTLIEATIEEKAKKRRRSERPASPTFKPGT